MASVFVVPAYAVVSSGRVVGMVGVTCNVGARCWSVLDIRMRTVCVGLRYSRAVFVPVMRGWVRHVVTALQRAETPTSAPGRPTQGIHHRPRERRAGSCFQR